MPEGAPTSGFSADVGLDDEGCLSALVRMFGQELRSNRDRDDTNAAMRSLGLAELALQDASPQGER